jgi:hypothetical protein
MSQGGEHMEKIDKGISELQLVKTNIKRREK